MSAQPETFWQHLVDAPFEQRFIEAHGVRTRVLEAGDGPPLVFLHGITSHLEAHLTLVPELSTAFRVVLYDMPGRGLSEKPDRDYTIDYLSEHLVGLLDALAIQRAHLCGQSLGGWIAAWAAAHEPRRVSRLILNNPGNVRSRPEALAKVRESNRRMMVDLEPDAVRARFAWLFHDKRAVSDEHVAIRYAMYSQPGFDRAMRRIDSILDPNIRERYVWKREWCGRIGVPTLLIWSRHNPLATEGDMRMLTSWIPEARLLVLECSAEFPQLEERETFADLVRDFLAGVRDGEHDSTRCEQAP